MSAISLVEVKSEVTLVLVLDPNDYRGKLAVIARANRLELKQSAKLASLLGTSNSTILDIRDKPGHIPRSDAAKKINDALPDARRVLAGYDRQSTEQKRARLVGMIQSMSDFAIEEHFATMLGWMRDDADAELESMRFAEPTAPAAADEQFAREVLDDAEVQPLSPEDGESEESQAPAAPSPSPKRGQTRKRA